MKRIIFSVVTILLMTACRSQKEASALCEERVSTYSDSISTETESTSVSNNTETINIHMLSEETGERVKFQDKGGEIHFLPDGMVTMTGVAAYEIRDKISQQKIAKEASQNDSIRLIFGAEASHGSSAASEIRSEKPAFWSFLKKPVIWLIAIFIIVISIKILWRRLKN